MDSDFKDRFSNHAPKYRLYRPAYPDRLFSHLASLAPSRETAWDCATGNGQSAARLSETFKQVYATDASSDQITHAIRKPNILYSVSPAHATALHDKSVDLITVAQAIHWFDNEPFYREVRRVLKTEGIIAAWAYHLPEICPGIDRVIGHLYYDILGRFWEKEISHIRSKYTRLFFPFEELRSPVFTMKTSWSLAQLTGHLQTWSAVETYREKNGDDPLDLVAPDLLSAWGRPSEPRDVAWQIFLKTGRQRSP